MTMKQIAPFLLVAALSACGQSETPKQILKQTLKLERDPDMSVAR